MRSALTVFLLIATNLHASGFEKPKTYRDALEICAGANMAKLDDRTSPAEMVASALLGVCQQECQALRNELASQRSESWLQGYEKAALRQFTIYVLMHRTGAIDRSIR
jgi:hypothetical protein